MSTDLRIHNVTSLTKEQLFPMCASGPSPDTMRSWEASYTAISACPSYTVGESDGYCGLIYSIVNQSMIGLIAVSHDLIDIKAMIFTELETLKLAHFDDGDNVIIDDPAVKQDWDDLFAFLATCAGGWVLIGAW